MVSFVVYDLIFMSVFIIAIAIFLSREKGSKNLKRQGIMFLYHTQFGVKFIDKFAKKYRKILMPMRYFVILSGFVLMGSILWLMFRTTQLYLTTQIANVIRAPPVAPLIPYFPEIFGLESFFPPLYFTYFIIALAIVILVHEGAHGVFARLENFKVHSTGFVFLGPIPGAFVEPDEKQMDKGGKIPQMSVLAAGTFANVVTFAVFGLLMIGFFAAFFSPAGVIFSSYAVTQVPVSSVTVIGVSEFEGFSAISVEGENYFANTEALGIAQEEGVESLFVYLDSPAFRAQIPQGSAITSIDGERVDSRERLSEILSSKAPGEEINIEVSLVDTTSGAILDEQSFDLELDDREGNSFLGVGFAQPDTSGAIGFIYKHTLAKVKEPLTHYESSLGNFGWFIYYLLWWIVVINILVALFNMLPLGMLDGGKFFMLTVAGLTGSKKSGDWAFRIATWAILLMLAALMVRWIFIFF